MLPKMGVHRVYPNLFRGKHAMVTLLRWKLWHYSIYVLTVGMAALFQIVGRELQKMRELLTMRSLQQALCPKTNDVTKKSRQ